MEKRPLLSTPEAQLCGSIAAIMVVALGGLLGVSMLAERFERARSEAEQASNSSWVYSVVSGANIEAVASTPREVSDPARLGSKASASIVDLYEHGIRRATAMKFVAPGGYNGDIWIALAIDENGSIIGLKIVSHRETPGFADVITQADSSWTMSLVGRSLKSPEPRRWQLQSDGGEIDGVSGATITASAVVAGVYSALNYLDRTTAGAKE